MKIYIVLLFLLLLGCGAQYVDSPNARILVTSSYDGSDESIVATSKCRPMVDCINCTKAQCALAYYEASQEFMNAGREMIEKQLYVSAKIEYMQAICRLEAAKILLNEAKLDNFEEYKSVVDFDLENKIKEKIDICDRNLNYLRWK